MSVVYCFECDKHVDTDYEEHECFFDKEEDAQRAVKVPCPAGTCDACDSFSPEKCPHSDSPQKVSRHGARSGKPEDTNDTDTKEVRKK